MNTISSASAATRVGIVLLAAITGLLPVGLAAEPREGWEAPRSPAEPLDHRSDLFSLGSVLYAMCTGRPPFRAAGTVATLTRVCEDTPRPLRELNPDLPEWLMEIISDGPAGGGSWMASGTSFCRRSIRTLTPTFRRVSPWQPRRRPPPSSTGTTARVHRRTTRMYRRVRRAGPRWSHR